MVAASGICVGAAGVAFKCHLKAKCVHPWLTKCRKRKGDLVVRCHPNPNKRNIVRREGDLVVECDLKGTSGHPWLAERRKGDLGVKCQLKAKSCHPWLAERR